MNTQLLTSPLWTDIERGLQQLSARDDPALWEQACRGLLLLGPELYIPSPEVNPLIHQVSPRHRDALAIRLLHHTDELHCDFPIQLGEVGALELLAPLAGEIRGLQIAHLRPEASLAPLSAFTRLTRLTLSTGAAPLPDLAPLTTLTGLLELSLSGSTQPLPLSFFSAFERLRRLSLSAAGAISDLRPLTALTRLDTLRLEGFDLGGSLAPLAELRSLWTLALCGCRSLPALSALAAIPRLSGLDLSGSPISALHDLPVLPGLESLTLDRTGIRDLSGLSAFTSLQELSLRDTGALSVLRASDLPPMLRRIELRGCAGVPPDVQSYFRLDDRIRHRDISALRSVLQTAHLPPEALDPAAAQARLSVLLDSDLERPEDWLAALTAAHAAMPQPAAWAWAHALVSVDAEGALRLDLRVPGPVALSIALLEHQGVSLDSVRQLKPGFDVTSIRHIGRFSRLEVLDLEECDALESLEGLESLACLRELTLDVAWEGPRLELAPLRGLARLEVLRLSLAQENTDISALASLTALRRLTMQSDDPVDPGLLAGMPLEVLSLSCEPLDLSGLEALAGLRALTLPHSSPGPDLSALSELRNLTMLKLGSCEGIRDFSALGGLVSLTRLELSGLEAGADLSALGRLPVLEALALHGRGEHLASLCAGDDVLPSLRRLSLGQERLPSEATLSRLERIESLSLSIEAVDPEDTCNPTPRPDLSPLSRLHGLRRLEIHPMQFSRLPVLPGLTHLKITSRLYSDTQTVSSLAEVGQMVALEELSLNCPAAGLDFSPLSGLPRLRRLELGDVGPAVDLGTITTLPALRELRIQALQITALPRLPDLKRILLTVECFQQLRAELLEGMPGLEEVYLGSEHADLSVLSGCPALKRVTLIDPTGASFPVLAGLEHLEEACIKECELAVLPPLPPSLTRLTLVAWPNLQDLSSLRELPRLIAATANGEDASPGV